MPHFFVNEHSEEVQGKFTFVSIRIHFQPVCLHHRREVPEDDTDIH